MTNKEIKIIQVVEQKKTPFGQNLTYELVRVDHVPSLSERTYLSPLKRPSRSVERFSVGNEIWLTYTDDVYIKFDDLYTYEYLFESSGYLATIIIDGTKSYIIYKLTSESIGELLKYYNEEETNINSKISSGYTVLTTKEGSSLIMLERSPSVYQGYWVEDTISETYLRKHGLIP